MQPEVPTKVAIVTPVHNRRETTLQCIRSLSRVQSESLEVSIFVVDDGSTDGTSEAVRSAYPNVNIVPGDGNLWYTEGTNVGIRAALEHKPDFVLAINDDSVFDAKFLHHLVATAQANPKSVVGPLLLLWNEPHRLFLTSPKWSTFEGGWKHWNQQTVWTVPNDPWEVDLIVGNCVLYPVSAFSDCGLMDSGRFPNFGDAEFTPRLKRSGYRLIIDPRARAFCQPNAVPRRLRDRNVKELARDLILDLKHPSNFTRLFLSHIGGGPSVAKGAAAWIVYLGNTIFNRFRSTPLPQKSAEPPLAEVFDRYVLTRK